MTPLQTDGIGYDILERAIEEVRAVPGLFLEIGTRRGGSMKIIIDAAKRTGQNRHFVSVDPYGDIPYRDRDGNVTRYDYTNHMKCEALAALYGYAAKVGVNLVTFTMTDSMFFAKFLEGVPIYDKEIQYVDQFAFAFLDGPHDTGSVCSEISHVSAGMPEGGQIVIDNWDHFNVDEVIKTASVFDLVEVERNSQKIRFKKI